MENEGKIEIIHIIMEDHHQKLNSLMKATSFTEIQDKEKSMTSQSLTSDGTPLEIATQSGFYDAAKLLIENGANFRTKGDTDEKQHLLLHAVLKGNTQFADFLVKKDPNLVNVRTEKGETYLHVAIDKLQLNAVIILLKMNIEKDAKCRGETALEYAKNKLEMSLSKSAIDDVIYYEKLEKEPITLYKIIKELKKEKLDISEEVLLNDIDQCRKELKGKEENLKNIEAKRECEIEKVTKEENLKNIEAKR